MNGRAPITLVVNHLDPWTHPGSHLAPYFTFRWAAVGAHHAHLKTVHGHLAGTMRLFGKTDLPGGEAFASIRGVFWYFLLIRFFLGIKTKYPSHPLTHKEKDVLTHKKEVDFAESFFFFGVWPPDLQVVGWHFLVGSKSMEWKISRFVDFLAIDRTITSEVICKNHGWVFEKLEVCTMRLRIFAPNKRQYIMTFFFHKFC